MLDELGSQGLIDWSRAVLDSTSVRVKRGSLIGPNPVDRGKSGSKIHVLSDRAGVRHPLRHRPIYQEFLVHQRLPPLTKISSEPGTWNP